LPPWASPPLALGFRPWAPHRASRDIFVGTGRRRSRTAPLLHVLILRTWTGPSESASTGATPRAALRRASDRLRGGPGGAGPDAAGKLAEPSDLSARDGFLTAGAPRRVEVVASSGGLPLGIGRRKPGICRRDDRVRIGDVGRHLHCANASTERFLASAVQALLTSREESERPSTLSEGACRRSTHTGRGAGNHRHSWASVRRLGSQLVASHAMEVPGPSSRYSPSGRPTCAPAAS
jgi:hypothetical protein